MQRIVQGLSATLQHTFYSDGVAADPSPATATVTITRDDGTDVVTSQAATRLSAGVFTYTVTPIHTVLLDTWTVGWTATFGGQSQTFEDIVEVAGGPLFTLAEARSLKPLDSLTAYPTAAIVEARTMVETALENACGVAFVPRYGREIVSGDGTTTLMLVPRLRSIRSVSVDGVPIAAPSLAGIKVLSSGVAYNPAWWAGGFANLEIAYEHGHDFPPPRVSQAALLWAKNFLVKGPIDDRTTSVVSEDGTFALSTPGMRGATTGIPEVDAVISQYSLQVGIA
jgi:hypothetical protein